MNLIFIYGAPAVGKLTVAKELASKTGYKLFHNHLTVDLVRSLFDYGTEQAVKLSSKFRLEMFEEAAKANISGVIFTYVYAKGLDDESVQEIIERVEGAGGNVFFVLLKAEKDELLKRVEEESRKEYTKVHTAKELEELLEKYDMASPVPQKESLIIENTNLSPEASAKEIIEKFNLPISQ
jgi:shikimate kinase